MKKFSAAVLPGPGYAAPPRRAGKPSRAPAGLGKASRAWWRRLVVEYSIEDPAGLLLLETMLRAHDRMVEARDMLDREGITITDRFDQMKPHPATVVERDSRAGMLAAMRQLNLDLEPLRDGPGRPPGS